MRIKGTSKRNLLRGKNGNDVLFGMGGNDRLFGFGKKDQLMGGNGIDWLDGGKGIDKLIGGKDNDTYVVDHAKDQVKEKAGQGIDTVRASVSYVLGANLENLVLTGNAALSGTGNALANTITGNKADNLIDGGIGKDTLIGGDGNDIYLIDDAGDVVIEQANGGTDIIRTTLANYALPANVEFIEYIGKGNFNVQVADPTKDNTGNSTGNLPGGNVTGGGGNDTVSGGSGNDTLSGGSGQDDINGGSGNDTVSGGDGNDTVGGGSGNDTVVGGSGNDILDGGLGADTLIGGLGDDTYVVDNALDTVEELLDQGIDLVKTTVDCVLRDNVENLELLAGAVQGTGNALANSLLGNAGNNILDGGLGADTLIGGLGDDTYVVDNALDTVEELLDQGIDLVKATVDYVLRDNVENLELLAGAVQGTGNALANSLLGNAGNNILDGGLGADTLIGGLGDDTYWVNSALDQVQEAAGSGTDLVKSAVDYVLGDNQENLELLDGNLQGTGNELANQILGTAGNNLLQGGGANDTLLGGAGNDQLMGGTGLDQLTGGTGIDTFALKELGEDLLTDFNSGEDVIALDKATFGLTSLLDGLLGASEFAAVANDATAQLGAMVVNPLARIIYSSETGKLFFDQNGLVGGLGSGGMIAQLGDPANGGTAPVLSSANFLVDAIS